MEKEDKKLDWFISENGKYLVISFVGSILETTGKRLQECEDEINRRSATRIVLNFFNVDEMSRGAIRPLARLEKIIRDKPANLRLCFLKPDHEKLLIWEGVARPDEIMENLVIALKSFQIAEDEEKKLDALKKAS